MVLVLAERRRYNMGPWVPAFKLSSTRFHLRTSKSLSGLGKFELRMGAYVGLWASHLMCSYISQGTTTAS